MADRSKALAVWAWVLYDFANTIFSVSILTVFFPLWVDTQVGNGAPLVNAATAVSALLVLFTAPLLGAVADLRQRRVPYLVALTFASVALTAALGVAGGVVVGVALFVAADLAYQSALVFYNALLPGVAVGRGAGRISGYGTAAGYVGTILALVVLTFFVVPDSAVRPPRPVSLGAAYRDVVRTLRRLRGGYTGMGTFILATVLYMDAANTAISNMALYGREVFGMVSAEVRNLLLFSTVFAVVGSAVSGIATDRAGPKRTLLVVLVLWLVAIVLTALAPAAWTLFFVGPLVGVALGGTWTVSRVMLVALSPPEKLGEFFGLFSLAGRFSAVLGPALTAILLLSFGRGATAYRVSIGSLTLIMALGIFLLLRVPDARPDPTLEEFMPEALVKSGERRD